MTLWEMTLLVAVLVQSTHIDIYFQALLVENKEVMRETRCSGLVKPVLVMFFTLTLWRVDLPI